MDQLLEIASWFFMIAGAFFVLTGSLGLLRMPDFYTRLHPAGVTDSFGAPLILVGIALQSSDSVFIGKIVLLIIFLFLTGPTSTHAVAKSAMLSGVRPIGKGDDKL
ncbi:monovalent cation/H(+) antiporter subunit G [Rickettsiales bacterium]|nr:monovalent cation/H(+) antiporter subunit G [Rickettsiales bacterium]